MRITASWLARPEILALTNALGESRVRFVGGCVRDTLLGREAGDVDAATILPLEEVTACLMRSGIRAIPTGLAHGTVTALINGVPIEVTTLRRDVATDGRHAMIAFTEDWKEDALRRDFTINALYCDISGNVHDYVGGLEDIKAKRLRFIGDPLQRIEEDALRILRFFRFTAQLGIFPMDMDALAACHARASDIDQLSGERIQQEMFKLLVAPHAADALEAMQHILPHVMLAQPRIDIVRKLVSPTPVTALAALLRHANKQEIDRVAERWKLSRAHRAQLHDFTHPFALPPSPKEQKRLIRAWGKEKFITHVQLFAAEHHNPTICKEAIALAQSWAPPIFPVTGEDLHAIGLSQGKQLGDTLRQLEAYWEEQDYRPDKSALLARLEHSIPK